MKKLIQFLVLVALVSTLALSAVAQTPAAGTPTTAASGQDDTEAKAALYKKFTDNIKTNPDVAYEAGKEYLTKYEAGAAADDPYVKYIKKWVASYEKVARRTQFFKQLDAKDYNSAFASAKQVLVDFPDDLDVIYGLVKAGFAANTSNNDAFNVDAAMYAKKTIQLVQAGKNPEASKPKDEVLGNLNYAVGLFLRKTQPLEAVTYFINAAQLEGFAKKDPQTYIFLADLYESTEYSKLATDYKAQCTTAEQLDSQACKDLGAKVNSVVDRIIDALARAVAYSNTAPNPALYNQSRTAWMETLTNFYKFRNNNEVTGLKELIAGITSRPIPKPGEAVAPLTPQTTPSTSSSSTPTTQGNTTNTSGAKTTTTTTTPANTKQGTTPATTTPSNGKTTSTQPTGKATSTKTTPKRAHARGKRN